MRYQVPQFIEVEDKIFGPLTIKQFIYIAGAAGLTFLLYKILPLFVALLVGIPVLILGFMLAFYKVNNKPFINVLESGLKFYLSNKLYIWKQDKKKAKQKMRKKEEKGELNDELVPKLSQSKLKDLSWELDVKPNETVGQNIPNNIQ